MKIEIKTRYFKNNNNLYAKIIDNLIDIEKENIHPKNHNKNASILNNSVGDGHQILCLLILR